MSSATFNLLRGLSAAEYHASTALGSSVLRNVLRATPAHALAAMEEESNQAQQLGTAIHAAILEPTIFSGLVAIAPDVDKRTKEGKARWESFLETTDGRTVITAEQGETLARVMDRYKALNLIPRLIESCPDREVSVFAHDKEADFLIKARLDAYDPHTGLVVDVKTTRSHASRDDFERAIASGGWGYGLQACHYRRVCRLANVPFSDFVFLVIETVAPFGIAAFALDADVIDMYESEVSRGIALWAKASKAKRFDAWPDEVQRIGVPAWERRKLEGGTP